MGQVVHGTTREPLIGANVLVDDDPGALVEAVANAVMPQGLPVLYGDGHASERIAQVLVATIPGR